MEKRQKNNGKAIVIKEQEPKEIVARETNYALEVANKLQEIVQRGNAVVEISGHKYLKFEGWQTLGRFFGYTVGVEKTEKIAGGYMARAVVYDKEGKIVGSAEASCTREERNWKEKPDFQLRSMAQTGACAKALRNILGWVAVLANFSATPAEEVEVENGNGNKEKKLSRKEVLVIAFYQAAKKAGAKNKEEALKMASEVLDRLVTKISEISEEELEKIVEELKRRKKEKETEEMPIIEA